jgi:hypothetical protein
MAAEKPKPRYMVIYRCNSCTQESGFTELDEPTCRYCDAEGPMELVSKKELTPEVMAARLKEVSDNMMKNLESAFQIMPDLEEGALPANEDAEGEMLKLLARVQKFRDQIQKLELRDPDDKETADKKE